MSIGWGEFLGIAAKKVPLCEECDQAFEKIDGEVCKGCGRLWKDVLPAHRREEHCLDCFKWEGKPETKGLLVMSRSVYTYNEPMKNVLAAFKYRGDAALAEIFEKSLCEVYQKYYKKDFPVVVPVPLATDRLYTRGFNQALLLAELLNMKTEEVLGRTESTKQSKKGRYERLHQENPFFVTKSVEKNILLVDDLYTTGTTLRLAAEVLREAGAERVASLTLIRS
ncbi:ComF family protein [Bacillus sp. THAF10]|uniref:ComF family protein n=1 Tax=Bacillus sp. THAF10 TaxID=2587848 RepID=UPI001562E141|nr:ComF family protein [Bacillus sp. THAF10]